MKTILLVGLLCFNTLVFGQEAYTEYFFKEIGWTIKLPNTFSISDSARKEELSKRGVKLLESANDLTVGSMTTLKDLISAHKGAINYVNATIRPYNMKSEGDFTLACASLKRSIYRSLASLPNVTVDSVSTITTIDKLSFDKFTLTISVKSKKYMTMIVLSKLYKGLDFGITYLYIDDETKQEIEEMLSTSKFN